MTIQEMAAIAREHWKAYYPETYQKMKRRNDLMKPEEVEELKQSGELESFLSDLETSAATSEKEYADEIAARINSRNAQEEIGHRGMAAMIARELVADDITEMLKEPE